MSRYLHINSLASALLLLGHSRWWTTVATSSSWLVVAAEVVLELLVALSCAHVVAHIILQVYLQLPELVLVEPVRRPMVLHQLLQRLVHLQSRVVQEHVGDGLLLLRGVLA